MEIDEGTLYPLLRRLESQGLLMSEWEKTRPFHPWAGAVETTTRAGRNTRSCIM